MTRLQTLATLGFVGLLGACAIGSPPGFSDGSTWTLPLVDPLADGRLLTPVWVDGKGPFLFVIDPETRVSVVDGEVFARAGIPLKPAARVQDQTDTTHPTFGMTLPNVRIGDLHISLLYAVTWGRNMFDADGRRIYGVLGRDVIADSLVFGVDRERGIAWLKTQEAFSAPPGAREVDYFKGVERTSVVNDLLKTTINGKTYDLAVDFGRTQSTLRPKHWDEAALDKQPASFTMIDHVGAHRDIDTVGFAAHVDAQGVARDHVGFVKFDDKRWLDNGELEGTLGLDFFQPYAIAADWHHARFYLTPREASPSERTLRLGRWGAVMDRCPNAGCATVSLGGDANAPELQVARDMIAVHLPLEVTIAATSATGQRLPTLTANLASGLPGLQVPIDTRYSGATLEVIDASPFPVACESPAQCVITEQPPQP